MKFVALDVETANADYASICQIGVVVFEHGAVARSWRTLVDPEDRFDGMNIAVHGIDERAVRGAPTLPQLFEPLSGWIGGQVVAHHTHFDKVALAKAAHKYGLDEIDCRWLDTAKVARRAWSRFATSGYGLANVAKDFGIEFAHHDAQEDARAAGEILLRAVGETGWHPEEWLVRVAQPIPRARPALPR